MAEVWTPPAFDDIATSELVTAAQLNALGNSLRFLKRVAHQTFTSNVTSTATTEGTAVQIVSAGAITFEAVPHMIVFYCGRVDGVSANTTRIGLFDSASVVHGRAAAIFGGWNGPITAEVPITPSAASHTYNFRVWCGSATTVTLNAGSGGADTHGPGFISIYRVPT